MCLGPVQHKVLDFVPMTTGLLLRVLIAIVLGFLCLPQVLAHNTFLRFCTGCHDLPFDQGRRGINYFAYNVSVNCATPRPLVMNGILSLSVHALLV